jgi:hypothetical protein
MLMFVIACADKPKSEQVSSINEQTTQSVLDHHMKSFQANDLEATLADYTEESVLITPDKTYKGLAEIRDNFIFAFSVLPKDSTILKMNKSVVVKDVAYVVWEADAPKLKFGYCTDTFIVQNGKIVRQTYAGMVTPK